MSVGTFTADALKLRTVDAGDWRDEVEEAIASGRGFVSLHALDDTGNATVRALFDGANHCFSRAAASTQPFRRSSTLFPRRPGTSAKRTIYMACASMGTAHCGLSSTIRQR